MFNFEVNFDPDFLITNSEVAVVHEGSSGGGVFPQRASFPQNSNSIISSKQGIHVHMKWTAEGPLHLILNNNADWICSVYLEQMGGAEAAPGNYVTNAAVTGGAQNDYNVTVFVPRGLAPGMYRLVYSITLRHTPSGMPLPVAGFQDGGFLQVFPGI